MSRKRHPSAIPAQRRAARDERAAVRAAKKSEAAVLDTALRASVSGTAAAGAADSFQNFGLSLGIGTQNALSGSTYGFNPITRNRTLLEWIYRGTWIGGVAVDLRAEDMTRAGIQVNSTIPPDQIEKLTTSLTRRGFWRGVCNTKRWANLYGGAIGVLLIDGQDLETPLRVETVGRGAFRGVAVLDRYMVEPTIGAGGLVEELGPHLGKPKFYNVRSDSLFVPGNKIHYSRCLRLLGDEMPPWQSVMENLWGISVYERIYDRLVAFDSATAGAAQSVYKSHIRTYSIEGLREIVTAGGKSYQGLLRYVQMMKTFQGIEGVTLLDGKDKFEPHTPNIQSGISEALIQFGQQLCGALRVPAVRLFGMSPAGLNSTGDSDWRNYYDSVLADQDNDLREFVDLSLRVNAKSQGIELPPGFGFNFTPLWQMTSQQKAEVAERKANSVILVKEAGLLSTSSAMKELRQQSHETGVFTNITDEDIEDAEQQDDLEPPGAGSVLGGQGAAAGEPPGGTPGPGRPAPEGSAGPVSLPRPKAAPTSPSPPRLAENDARVLRGRGPYMVASAGDDWSVVCRGARDGELAVVNNRRLPEADARELCLKLNRPRAADGLPLVEIGGLPILIECPAGERRWPGGPVQPADYGYIRRTRSAEGDDEAMDCFVGTDSSATSAYVINHLRRDGSFEEHKVMLRYPSLAAALADYRAAYPGSPARGGAVMPLDELPGWLAGDVTRPIGAAAS